jgi:hypothetical protein
MKIDALKPLPDEKQKMLYRNFLKLTRHSLSKTTAHVSYL